MAQGFAEREVNANGVLQAVFYWATAQDDVVNGSGSSPQPRRSGCWGVWWRKCGTRWWTSTQSTTRAAGSCPIAAEPVGKVWPVVTYDITTEDTQFIDPLNTLTTRLAMGALQDIDSTTWPMCCQEAAR